MTKELTKGQELWDNFVKSIAKMQQTHFAKMVKREADKRVQIGVIKTGKYRLTPEGKRYEVQVKVTQYIGPRNKNKYNHKLLERERVKKSLAKLRESGDTLVYRDGTPVNEGRIVELWQ